MKIFKFGALFHFIRNGMNVKQDRSGNGLPITRIETIADSTVNSSRVGYAGLKEDGCINWLMESGDILFSHINSVEHIGKCAIYRGVPGKLVHGMNLLCLRCDTAKILPEFAKYLIRSPEFRLKLSKLINKAVNQASVSIGNLRAIPVFLPPLAKQKQIAIVLDQTEALRVKCCEAIIYLDELAQSIFLDMFGDPVTNPMDWPRASVREVGKVVTGNTPKRTKINYYGDDIEWIKSDNISERDDYITEAEEYLSREGAAVARTAPTGSILVTCIAGSPNSIGNVAMVDREVAFNQQINAIIPASQSTRFLYMQLVIGKRLVRSASTGGMKGMVSKSRFEEVMLILPPAVLQEEFSRRAEAVEHLKVSHRAHLAELDALFASLQYRAFRGEL